MLRLLLFASCIGFSAARLAALLAARQPEPLTRTERGIWIGVISLALWLGIGWTLAIPGFFNSTALCIAAALVLVVLLAATRRQRAKSSPIRWSPAGLLRRSIALDTLLPLVVVGLWVAYSTAALHVIPVSNHDALSYHFAKAIALTTTGRFALYASNDLRVTFFPDNYEILAATFLTFLRSDTWTGLITSGSLLLYLATGFSLFSRVWGRRVAMLTLPLLLSSPVLLLHTTAHKNDILMSALTLNTLFWLGRYAARGEAGSAVIGIAALALALGTKFHGMFLVVTSLAFAWRAWRAGVWRPRPAVAAMQLAAIGAALLLLGGVPYVANILTTGHVMGFQQVPTPNAMNTVAYPAWWQVPRFTWMFLAAPLLTYGHYFMVPWSGQLWFWPAYELYFSHYGAHVSLLILLLPIGVRWTRRQLEPAVLAELGGISIAALMVVGFTALMGIRPYGSFAFIPRFLFFALPVLLVWTWCPAVAYLLRIRSSSLVPLAATVAIAVVYMGVTMTRDRFSPFDYVERLWFHPESRRQIFHSSWRAASVIDLLAPPDAVVAIDAGYDGWMYPAYGAALSRHVQPILDAPGPYVPGPEVQWVGVDRAFSIVWGHPDFRSMALASVYIDRGPLTAADRRVYDSLAGNPDFKRVYFFPIRFQAVFQRIRPSVAGGEGRR